METSRLEVSTDYKTVKRYDLIILTNGIVRDYVLNRLALGGQLFCILDDMEIYFKIYHMLRGEGLIVRPTPLIAPISNPPIKSDSFGVIPAYKMILWAARQLPKNPKKEFEVLPSGNKLDLYKTLMYLSLPAQGSVLEIEATSGDILQAAYDLGHSATALVQGDEMKQKLEKLLKTLNPQPTLF